jgi:hypothetical protein
MPGIVPRVILIMTMTGQKVTGEVAQYREAGKKIPENHAQVVRTLTKRRLPHANGADITAVSVIRLAQWILALIGVRENPIIINSGGVKKNIATDVPVDLIAVLHLLHPAQKATSRRNDVGHVLRDMQSMTQQAKRLQPLRIDIYHRMSN